MGTPGPALARCAFGALMLVGCGGGSGPGIPPPDEYHIVALQRDVAGDSVGSFSVRYASLEGGSLRGGSGYASATGGPAAQPDLPFAVDAQRAMDAAPPWGPPVAGRMSEDGVLGAAAATAAGASPAVLFVVRRHPSPTLGDLVGEWFTATYIRRPAAPGGSSTTCTLAEAQISPAGVFAETGASYVNDDGIVAAGTSLTSPSPVALDADGWIRIDGLGTSYVGGLSVDGNVILLASRGSGVVGVPAFAEIQVLVRRGLALDVGQTLGTHAVSGFQQSGPAFAALTGSATVVGATGGTTSLVGNVDGSATPAFFPGLDLHVQVSGKCLLALGALQLRGASGPQGRYLLVTGGYATGDEPGVYAFVR